jgi:hypothetical protein
MDISNLNKAEVLATLYNNSRSLGMGVQQFKPGEMAVDEAQALLDEGQTRFDYLHGRVMKVNLKGDELRTHLYNRDNGPDAAEQALAALVAT